MDKETRTILTGVTSADLRIRAHEDGSESRTIEGYAIVFGQRSVPMWSEDGKPVVEVVETSAISRELLDNSRIKMTMYHDFGRLLARSHEGKGTLSYDVDERGVRFSFDAPETSYGDEALELVRRGDIDGCSFMFATQYGKRDHVEREETEDAIVYHVRKILAVYDFTLTPDPAYPQTECEARSTAIGTEATEPSKQTEEPKAPESEQWREMLEQIK